MAIVSPFRALRYDLQHVGNLRDVVAPPYDVIDAEQQDALYKRHPANVVRLILNRAEPGDDAPDVRYQRAAQFLTNWREEGILRLDSEPALYLYQQEFIYQETSITRSGFLARLRLEPFGQGSVFPHEETHAAAKADRLKLIAACQANLSPIFGLYPDPEREVDRLIRKAAEELVPEEATDDLGVVHRMWAVTDSGIATQVTRLMQPRPIFIADGHHRYETGLNYLHEQESRGSLSEDHPARFVLMMHVGMSDPGMVVLPTHRLFRGLPPIDSVTLRDQLAACFDTRLAGERSDLAETLWSEMATANRQSKIALFAGRDERWVVADLNDQGRAEMEQLAQDHSPVWRELGVSILHRLVVDSILKATDLPQPMYVHSATEVTQHLDSGDTVGRDATGQQGTGGRFPLAALVMPATLDHVRDISRTGERMPAKSTYFFPKLLSGLVINPLTAT